MAFPKSLLADHERLVFDLRPHWIALVPSVLWTIAAIAVGIVSGTYVFNDDGKYQGWELGIVAVIFIAWYWLAVLPALRWRFTMFVLTSDRLITREGIIAKHSREIPLERINDVSFSQSVFERMLGAGDLMVESAGERGQTRITSVRKPEQVQLMIYKETEANSGRVVSDQMTSAGRGRSSQEPSIPEQIEALARLKDSGAISEAEFEAKKQDLLKRM